MADVGIFSHISVLSHTGQMTEAERALLEAIALGRESGDKFALFFTLTI
jgi:hypothetical protein